MPPLRRSPVVALLTGLALAVSTALTGCTPAPDTYVALGDSFVAGPLIPLQRTDPPGCLRSTRNYPSLAVGSIKVTRFVDVSCSGAKTTDLYAPQGTYAGPANAPQLDALDGRTKVVTIGIGGNDFGFTGIVETCVSQSPTGPGCKPEYVRDGRDELSERIATVAPKVRKALRDIRARAPQAAVFMVGYPTVLPETGTGCYPLVPILPSDVVYLRAKAKELNTMLRQSAAATGAHYVDTAAPSVGHDICQLPTVRWVEGLVPTAPAAPVHPNAAGMRATSVVVSSAVNRVVTR